MKKLPEITPANAGIFVFAGLALAGITVGLGSLAYKAAYCQSLNRQHVQHRNATAAMGADLDRRFGQRGYSYKSGSTSLSDAMFNSLKRTNDCI